MNAGHRSAPAFVSVVLFISHAAVVGQSAIVRAPDSAVTLNARWDRALKEGEARKWKDGWWVGYRISRLMGRDSYIGNCMSSHGIVHSERSLYETVEGYSRDSVAAFMQRREQSYRRLHNSDILQLKDIAIAVRLGDSGAVEELRFASMELSISFSERPLVWLGYARDDESVALLNDLYSATKGERIRQSFVEAIGIHQRSDRVLPILLEILRSSESDKVRAEAISWIPEHAAESSLGILTAAAERDRSADVRERSVFAISQLQTANALDTLIMIARRGRDEKLRGRATFWLGQKASEKALSALEDIITTDDDLEVQRQALYALSQQKAGAGLDKVIDVAKNHPSRRLRKVAINTLSQSEDPRAREALIDILKN